MTDFKDIKVGDTVEAVVRGTVDYVSNGSSWLQISGVEYDKNDFTSITVVEPPVEYYGPGDIVESLSLKDVNGKFVRWTLVKSGYLPHQCSKIMKYSDTPLSYFNSKNVKKVL